MWCPAEFLDRVDVEWLRQRELGSQRYPIEVARGLARILEVPQEWVFGDVPPDPPPVEPLSEVERLYLDNGLKRYAERWIQARWRGEEYRNIKI